MGVRHSPRPLIGEGAKSFGKTPDASRRGAFGRGMRSGWGVFVLLPGGSAARARRIGVDVPLHGVVFDVFVLGPAGQHTMRRPGLRAGTHHPWHSLVE